MVIYSLCKWKLLGWGGVRCIYPEGMWISVPSPKEEDVVALSLSALLHLSKSLPESTRSSRPPSGDACAGKGTDGEDGSTCVE